MFNLPKEIKGGFKKGEVLQYTKIKKLNAMKTITLQGEVQKFDNLFQASSNFDEDRLPYEVEIRAYVVENVDSIGLMSDTLSKDKHYSELTDEEFMTVAEEDGRVYTLDGFQEAFNLEEINSAIDIVRLISVPVFI
jgi:hypothetical protein